MQSMKSVIRVLSYAAGAAMTFASASAQITVTPVALTGAFGTQYGIGPGVEVGVTFFSFNDPVMNNAGQIVFTGRLIGSGVNSTNNFGIWSDVSGSLTILARNGTDGALGPNLGAGVVFPFTGTSTVPLSGLTISNSGQITFRGRLSGSGVTTANDTGLWGIGTGETLVLIREGATGAPGFASSTWTSVSMDADSVNLDGTIVQVIGLAGGGVTSANNAFIWTINSSTGPVNYVARRGPPGPGPGLDAGTTFATFSSSVVGRTGIIGGRATLQGTVSGTCIWHNAGGSNTVLALTGTDGPLGPQLGAGIVFFGLVTTPTINTAGTMGLYGTLTGAPAGEDSGFWSCAAGGMPTLIAREGTDSTYGPQFGPGVTFTDFGGVGQSLFMCDNGKIFFTGRLAGTGVDTTNETAVFTSQGGVIEPFYREGTDGPLGPGLGAGVVINSIGSFSSTQSAINPDGDHLSVQHLLVGSGGVTASNDQVLLLKRNGMAAPQVILRDGDIVDVDPSGFVDNRTLSSISFVGFTGGSDGRPRGFNDSDTIAARLSFTDGSQGIFRIAVPQPPPQCNPDYNMDGGADNADVTDLANDIASGMQSFPPNSPDFNNDGSADNADIGDIADVIAGSPCP